MSTCGVSLSALDIVVSAITNILSTNLIGGNTIFFFGWMFGCLEDEQKPVFNSLSRIGQKVPCTETGIAKPSKQLHRSLRWHVQDKWHTYFFLNVLFYLKFCWNAGNSRSCGKIAMLFYIKKIFWGNTHFFEKFLSDNTKPVGLFGFRPKLGLFHFAKLPSFMSEY